MKKQNMCMVWGAETLRKKIDIINLCQPDASKMLHDFIEHYSVIKELLEVTYGGVDSDLNASVPLKLGIISKLDFIIDSLNVHVKLMQSGWVRGDMTDEYNRMEVLADSLHVTWEVFVNDVDGLL